ncbi:MAG: 3-deoxy-7-phosphoheptulonate synthase [Planctomycetota bacterium]
MKNSTTAGMIFILKEGLAASHRNKLRTRLEQMGVSVKVVAGPDREYLELSGDDAPVRTLSPETWPGVERVVELSPSWPHAAWGAGSGRSATPTLVTIGAERVPIGPGQFTIMAGPCSVESYERTLEIARAVRDAGAQVFRAGAFKPRSSPYAFQGLGREGLEILKEVRAAAGLPIVTEVLDVRHVDEVRACADLLQVGSRNMQNYALLKELSQLRQPILLKRGYAATLNEFLLAAEYLLCGGNDQVILCERGVRSAAGVDGVVLDLGTAVELREHTHLPIVVDPSHGTGATHRVLPLARAAAAAGVDGLLVEVHTQPETALSDGKQALTVAEFQRLVAEVVAVRAALDAVNRPSASAPLAVQRKE